MRACDPVVFIMHETIGTENEQEDLNDPQDWRLTPIWTSLCTRYLKCVKVCPEKAITVN